MDIQRRLDKVRAVYRSMDNMWRSTQYSVHTKLKLYQSCVLSTFMYVLECMCMKDYDFIKLLSFHTTSLRKILHMFWPKISNQDLLLLCMQEHMVTIITKRRWRWLGHVLQRETNYIIKTAFHWTPEGWHKQRRPKTT